MSVFIRACIKALDNEFTNLELSPTGGREHAISWIISKSKREIEKIYVMPGNAGTLSERNVFNIECDINNHQAVLNFALENNIDLTIVGPEVPLVEGISDLFEENEENKRRRKH